MFKYFDKEFFKFFFGFIAIISASFFVIVVAASYLTDTTPAEIVSGVSSILGF
ncbi:MAG: hypothetical protein WCW87_00255 [Candidatus Paceibacterota bacterium]